MALPLSCDLPLSHDLRNIFTQAAHMAQGARQVVTSTHLLFALYTETGNASALLRDHHVSLQGVARSAYMSPVEQAGVLETIVQRSERLARRARAIAMEPPHLLAAMLGEPRSMAYHALAQHGIDVGALYRSALRLASPARGASLHTTGELAMVMDATPLPLGFIATAQTPITGEWRRPSTPDEAQVSVSAPRQRGRERLMERSSPVHPALHESWVRTTPAQGSPALTREVVASAEVCEEVQDAGRKTLKDRFAERKAQLRERHASHHRTTTASTTQPPPPPPKPPATRMAQRYAPLPVEEISEVEIVEEIIDDILSEQPVVQQQPAARDPELARRAALEDARGATRSLAQRLFAKKSAPDAGAPAKSRPSRGRPDAPLASTYRLDPDRFPILSQYGRNLTEEAALQRIDPAIGRDQEITQLIDILGKRRSNNPLLVGDPGVGKTAIVEGLAHRFCALARQGNRMGKRAIVELELGRLLSGTHLRGSFSERLIAIKDEVRLAEGQVIVFLDELHVWMNAGQGGDGADASGELKTALARGQFPCVGATTEDEYRKFIESDPAFARRFQVVSVEEPDQPTAQRIARGVSDQYAQHHGVSYASDAIEAAVRLSHRYIQERRLPDKALNVLDLAGSRAARTGEAEVNTHNIAHIVAEMAGLPADRLTRDDRERFLEMEAHLARSVIGHEHVVHTVSEVLRRNYAGFRSKRPIGTLLFLGPTGVGKTEMVKALADFLFHDRDAIVRVDMSELMEAHAVSRLIGAPPGYVGHDQGGQLTEAVRRSPYQVVLLDEIEKAHPDILNLLLQLFDEGCLTDGRGRKVDFSNTLIVMTSNLGAEHFERQSSARARIGFGGASSAPSADSVQARDALTEQVRTSARAHFSPELWNRIEERLVFMPLGRDEVARIAALQIADTERRLREDSGITLQYTPQVVELLIEHGGYDPRHGARPMRQTIQRLIESNLARLILSGKVQRGDTIAISVVREELHFGRVKAPARA